MLCYSKIIVITLDKNQLQHMHASFLIEHKYLQPGVLNLN
jgi:hypothetical protein